MLLISMALNPEQRIPLCLSLSSWKVLTDLGGEGERKIRKKKRWTHHPYPTHWWSSLRNPFIEGQASLRRQWVGWCGCSASWGMTWPSQGGWWRQPRDTCESVRRHRFVSLPVGITLVLYDSVPQRKTELTLKRSKNSNKSIRCLGKVKKQHMDSG